MHMMGNLGCIVDKDWDVDIWGKHIGLTHRQHIGTWGKIIDLTRSITKH
jgi:hypothetical protein